MANWDWDGEQGLKILSHLFCLTFDSMVNWYLHSSQRRMSDDLIQRCRQSWCTYLSEPAQKQGAISGMPASLPQWQI